MTDYSKTFCPYPWIHVMTQPTSTVNFCCVASGQVKRDNDPGHPIMLDRGDKIEDVWNGEHYRKIRKQMIEGEQVEGCEPCYDLEKLGIPSYRENYIKDWMGWHRNADVRGDQPRCSWQRFEESNTNESASIPTSADR